MVEPLPPSSSSKGSALSPEPPGLCLPVAAPDARSARNPKGHFTQAFKLAAVRYAAECGKSQRAAALDMGVSDKTLAVWIGDARPEALPGVQGTPGAGLVDVQRFDELAQLRARVRQQDEQLRRVTAERDFLKKAAAYFATPTNGGSK